MYVTLRAIGALSIAVWMSVHLPSHAQLPQTPLYDMLLEPQSPYCGADCIYLLSRLQGIPKASINYAMIVEECMITSQGVSMLRLSEVAQKRLGREFKPIKCEFDTLMEATQPFVVLLNKNTDVAHWVVVVSCTPVQITYLSPPFDIVTQKRDEFLTVWSGYALLEFEPRAFSNKFMYLIVGSILLLVLGSAIRIVGSIHRAIKVREC